MYPPPARAAADATTADRMQLLDVSRFVAATGVVMAHVVDEFLPDSNVKLLGTFAVPFYLFVALYFTVRGLARSADRSVGGYLLGRVRRLYLPFLLWNLIYDGLHVAWHRHEHFTSPLLMTWGAVYTHLYFLPFLLVVTVAVSVVARPIMRSNVARRVVVVSLTLAAIAVGLGPQPTRLQDPMNVAHETLWNMYRSLPAGLAAAALALAVGGRNGRLKLSPAVGVAGLLLTVATLALQVMYGAHPILRALSGLGLMAVALVPFGWRGLAPVAALGRLSFGVYLAHAAVIRLAVAGLDHASVARTPLSAALVIVATLAVGFAMSALLARSRWTRWAIGCEPERKHAAVSPPTSASPLRIAPQRTEDLLWSGPR